MADGRNAQKWVGLELSAARRRHATCGVIAGLLSHRTATPLNVGGHPDGSLNAAMNLREKTLHGWKCA